MLRYFLFETFIDVTIFCLILPKKVNLATDLFGCQPEVMLIIPTHNFRLV